MRLTLVLCLSLSFYAVPALAQAPAGLPPCSAAEHRQFDFWVGTWDVSVAGNVAGGNEITLEEDGCVLHEHWRGSQGGTGQSFNFYDRAAKQWRQVWIDSGGNPLDLWGGLVEGKMVLVGKTSTPKGSARQRITWSQNSDGSIRQLWESSTDDGNTWAISFDGTYRKR